MDTVLKAGMGVRYTALGPFGIADFGGLDVFDRISGELNKSLSNSKRQDPLLHELVKQGKWGVKSGAGFYDYSEERAEEAIRERDRLYIELAKVVLFPK